MRNNIYKSECTKKKISRTTTGDDLIGSAFLGVNAVDKSEMEQWKNTIEHQGKEYKGVHHLKPAPRAPDVHVAEAPSDSDWSLAFILRVLSRRYQKAG